MAIYTVHYQICGVDRSQDVEGVNLSDAVFKFRLLNPEAFVTWAHSSLKKALSHNLTAKTKG